MNELMEWADQEGGIIGLVHHGWDNSTLLDMGLNAGQIAALELIKSHVRQIDVLWERLTNA